MKKNKIIKIGICILILCNCFSIGMNIKQNSKYNKILEENKKNIKGLNNCNLNEQNKNKTIETLNNQVKEKEVEVKEKDNQIDTLKKEKEILQNEINNLRKN